MKASSLKTSQTPLAILLHELCMGSKLILGMHCGWQPIQKRTLTLSTSLSVFLRLSGDTSIHLMHLLNQQVLFCYSPSTKTNQEIPTYLHRFCSGPSAQHDSLGLIPLCCAGPSESISIMASERYLLQNFISNNVPRTPFCMYAQHTFCYRFTAVTHQGNLSRATVLSARL